MSNTVGLETRTPATVIRVLALVIAMLLVAAATLQQSQSAFSGTTTYGSEDTVESATVKLSSTSSAPLSVGDLVPGDTIVRCVDVTYDGTAIADQLDSVRVYGTETSGGGLAQYLDINAEMGAAGSSCAAPGGFSGILLGKLDTVFTDHATYATAYDSMWTPAAAGQSRPFRFTFTFPAGTGDAAQGKTASPVITFEVRSKAGRQR